MDMDSVWMFSNTVARFTPWREHLSNHHSFDRPSLQHILTDWFRATYNSLAVRRIFANIFQLSTLLIRWTYVTSYLAACFTCSVFLPSTFPGGRGGGKYIVCWKRIDSLQLTRCIGSTAIFWVSGRNLNTILLLKINW